MLYCIIAVSPVASEFNDTIEQYRRMGTTVIERFQARMVINSASWDTIPFFIRIHSKWLTIHSDIELGNKGGGVDRGRKVEGKLMEIPSVIKWNLHLSSLNYPRNQGNAFSPRCITMHTCCGKRQQFTLFMLILRALGSCVAICNTRWRWIWNKATSNDDY